MKLKLKHVLSAAALGATVTWLSTPTIAQTLPATLPTTLPATLPATAPGQIKLNFPENMELKVLVDYVGQRQGINFIYDEQIGSKRVTIKAPQEIPASSLLTLVESALRMKGLVLSHTDIPGTMRIEAARQLTSLSNGPSATTAPAERSSSAVTRIFELKHTTPKRVEAVITPFLSVPTMANITSLAEQNIVIITDYAENMKRLADLVDLADRAGPDVSVQFYPVAQEDAKVVSTQVMQLLTGKLKARDGATATPPAVTVIPDERTNRLVVVGSVEDVKEALELIKQIDLPMGMETKIYPFATASAEEVDRLVKLTIGELNAKRFYKGVADHDSNLLIVTATPDVQRQVDLLVKTLDKPVTESQSPIRFYKLENAKATAVLETLQSIQGDTGLSGLSVDGVSATTQAASALAGAAAPAPDDKMMTGPTPAQVNAVDQPQRNGLSTPTTPKRRSVEVGDTRIMADEMSNTIIVVAKPAMHPIYEKLIKRLDVRRPQVLIEATLVTLDTTDEFKLGVEFITEIPINGGPGKILNFSNFGLSDFDPTKALNKGAVTLKPGIGFTGAVISTDIANIVLQALKTNHNIRVQAQPSVLVNDNAVGKLISQQEEPFTTVNASSQVALNTFGGYSSAGTNITVKPQISEGDNLKLEYDITLSTFNGASSSNGLPPARATDSLKSEATIPNGHTIIVGGLTRVGHDFNVDRIPILGEIPVLEYAFSNRVDKNRRTTLFVFLRAVVLRADKFEDLKILSSDAVRGAGLPGQYPTSEPVDIK